jgi:hypothetical protein
VLEGGYVDGVIEAGSRSLAAVSNGMDNVSTEGWTTSDGVVIKYFNKMIEQHRSLFPQYHT